jgi:uncharacterized OB-fold protein
LLNYPTDRPLTPPLHAPHQLAYTYRRSTGGATAVFLCGLAQAEIWGSVDHRGRVTVPPVDWDPESGAAAGGYVRVADTGTVTTWTWVPDPRPGDPLDKPYALALIRLEGADTALLHAVDVTAESAMRTGMTVSADWREDRSGSILDLRAFVPDGGEAGGIRAQSQAAWPEPEAVGDLEVVSDVHVDYSYEPGRTLSSFLTGLAEHTIHGGRCPRGHGVYVPSHPSCPLCRAGPLEEVGIGDIGTVTTYTIVHLPFPGMTIELPLVCAWIRLDGTDVSFAHLLGEIEAEEVRVGMRVQAVWVADEELAPTWESIRYFRPVVGA